MKLLVYGLQPSCGRLILGSHHEHIFCGHLVSRRVGRRFRPAQMAPKLALARVSIVPTLAEKSRALNAPDTNSSAAPLDLTGGWNGEAHSNGKVFPFVLTVTKPVFSASAA
jgi:hypothetical protein